jgi:uncharacterized protein YwgA
MKSTNNESKPFSMDDFEKGLMLAGLISPHTLTELNERSDLERYEKEIKNENKTTFFKRVVLAAEIAYQLHNEPTFGRIKFQKLVYLCEHVAQMNLHDRYSKQAAGPFDNKFMHSIEAEFKRNKWFAVAKVNDGKINRTKYTLLPNVESYKLYFQSYFGDQIEALEFIIDMFRTVKTDTAEIAATLYACQLDLRKTSDIISQMSLLKQFYNWSKEKKRFDQNTVIAIWHWMVENGLVVDILR